MHTRRASHSHTLCKQRSEQANGRRPNTQAGQLTAQQQLTMVYITTLLTLTKKMKCLKQVFRWASSPSAHICLKWEWYMCAYTRNSRLYMVRTTSMKLGGKGSPNWAGNTDGSSICSRHTLHLKSHKLDGEVPSG